MEFSQIPPEVVRHLKLSSDMDGTSGELPGYLTGAWRSKLVLSAIALVGCGVVAFLLLLLFGPIVEYWPQALHAIWVLLIFGLLGIYKFLEQSGAFEARPAILNMLGLGSNIRTGAVPFRIDQRGVQFGKQVFRWHDLAFIRLSDPSTTGSYMVLQVFDRRGRELRWRFDRTARSQVEWVLAQLRLRLRDERKGRAPDEIRAIRGAGKEGV